MSLLGRGDAPVVLNRLLEVKARDGKISRALVAQAAEALGVGEATVWRWVADGRVPDGQRSRFSLSEEDWTAYFQWCGSATAAWRQRRAEPGGPQVSLATYKRAIGRELSVRDRAFARDGEQGARRYSLWIRRSVTERNALFHTDHKRLDVPVLPPRYRQPVYPWVTTVMESHSRAITGWVISLRPTRAEVLAALAMAVGEGQGIDPFCGAPGAVRCDNGLEFTASAVAAACVMLGALALPTFPYQPQVNGRIERLHRTIDQEFQAGLPFYAGGPRRADRKLYAPNAPPLTLEAFVELYRDWVETYNHRRIHSELEGRTPVQAWLAETTPLRVLPEADLRRFLREEGERTVQSDGVHFRALRYVHSRLDGIVGETVEIRSRPHDLRELDIYRAGELWCTATPSDQADPEVVWAVGEARKAGMAQARRAMAARTRRHKLRLGALSAPGPAPLITVIDHEQLAQRRRELPARASAGAGGAADAVALLGLDDRLNQVDEHR